MAYQQPFLTEWFISLAWFDIWQTLFLPVIFNSADLQNLNSWRCTRYASYRHLGTTTLPILIDTVFLI